jgi:hypothetical protein
MVVVKFDECIVHIGTAKTGTKTLQEFLHKNKSNFARKCIFFPKTFGELNHVKLSAYASADDKKDDIRKNLGLIDRKRIEDFRKELDNSFRQEIENHNCKKLLLSGEHMQSRLTSVEEIQFLKKFLDNFVNKFKIVVYLRSQPEMAVSRYSTFCKSEGTRKTVLPEVNESNLYFNHEKLLERWSKVFGIENIIPRIFSRPELHDGDIKKDFIRILGLNWNDFEDVENSNESINADAQRFLLEINKFLPSFIDDKPNKDRGNIAELVSHNREGTGLLPTREQAEKFLKIFNDSNERLRKKWFPERKKLFEVDFSKYPEKLIENTDYTFAFKIFAELWSTKQEQIHSLMSVNRDSILLKIVSMKKKIEIKFRKFIGKK